MGSPVCIAVSGVTDANGALTIPISAPSQYGVLTLIAEGSGNPNWAVRGGAMPRGFSNGPQASMGPWLTSPAEPLTIVVTGASPNTTVDGQLVGAQYPTPEEAAAAFRPQANVVTVSTFAPQVLLGTVTAPVPPGTNVTKKFDVPTGAQVVGFEIDFSVSGNPAQIKITGHQTGQTYLAVTSAAVLSGALPGPVTAIIGSPLDTQIDVLVAPGVSTAVVDVLAFFSQVNVFAEQVPGSSWTVQEGNSPPPWQAPNLPPIRISATIAAGANLLVLAAAAGKTIYLFDWPLSFDAVVATGDLSMDGTVSGTKYVTWNQSVTVPALFDGHGAPLQFQDGVQLHNNNGAAAITARGAAVVSQA